MTEMSITNALMKARCSCQPGVEIRRALDPIASIAKTGEGPQDIKTKGHKNLCLLQSLMSGIYYYKENLAMEK